MTALCLLIAGAIGAIFLFNIPVSNLLLVLLVLICPFSHLLLGHGGRKSDAGGSHHVPASSTVPAIQTSYTK